MISCGGFRAGALWALAGIVEGEIAAVSRQAARPIVRKEQFKAWADEQVELLVGDDDFADAERFGAAEVLAKLGSSVRGLPIALTCRGYRTREQLVADVREMTQVVLVRDDCVRGEKEIEQGKVECELLSNVILSDAGGIQLIRGGGQKDESILTSAIEYGLIEHSCDAESGCVEGDCLFFVNGCLMRVVIDVIAEAWSVSVDELARIGAFFNYSDERQVDVAQLSDGRTLAYAQYFVVDRPRKD